MKIRKKLLTLLAIPALGLLAFAGPSVSAATVTVNPGDSIQSAIDSANPGDTIDIAAGTYTERIVVDKPLTIKGAQAGVDARNRSGSETIIQGPTSGNSSLYVIRVTSNDVTIDGVTVQTEAATDAFHGIQIPSSADIQNLIIVNNIVQNTGAGFFAYSNTSFENLLINKNAFLNNNRLDTSSSVYLANTSGSNIEISDNILRGNDNGADVSKAGINVGTTSSLSNVKILRNEAEGTRTFLVYNGIASGEISGNTATGAGIKSGIFIGLDNQDVTISDNNLKNYEYGVHFSTEYMSGGNPSSNVQVNGNTMTEMQLAGIYVKDGAYTGTLSLTNNSIFGNAIGINNESSATTVDANKNWWGCPGGPGANGCDTINGLVLANEWYVDEQLSQTNLDGVEAPGAPNTGLASGNSYAIVIAATIAGVALAGSGLFILRRQTN